MCPSSSSKVGGERRGSHVYLLNCSVCKGEFISRQKWVEHLTLDCHQKLARECLQKDLDYLKECSLVIFTTYDLTAEWAGKIIQFLGNDQSIWVTDFLWWEDRPRLAVVQFESRKKVEEVLRDFESSSGDLIQIENQGVQVKGAFHMLDLEWKAILPGNNPEPIVPPKSFRKSAKKNEASLSLLNNNHHQVSNNTTEGMGEDTTTEVNSGKDDEEDESINYIKLLFDLAEEQKWKSPNFKYEQVKCSNEETKYISTILLNGQVYKPRWLIGRAKSPEQAKQKAAKICLEALKSSKVTKNISVRNSDHDNLDDDDDTDDDDQEDTYNITKMDNNPVRILRALSKKLHGKSPEFKVTKVQKGRRYVCRVVLNGITYKTNLATGRAHTAEQAKIIAAQFCLETLKKDDGITAEEYLSTPNSHLSHQFTVISDFVEIPDEKCKPIVEIVKSFRDVLRKQVPSTQVIIFRNWFLKLRNSCTDDEPLLIYIYAENGLPDGEAPPSDDNFTWIPGRLVLNAISQFNELFVRSEITFPNPDDPNETRLGCKFLHKPSGFPFIVVNFKRTMVEVQISRLVKYFCEFDPRIRPLLILARYWVITNGIHWGEPEVTARYSHQSLPEPHPLDWIILTFLMGEKYVPSLRSVLERPHKPIFEARHRIDVGFSADGDFAREWKKKKGFKIETPEHLNLSTLQMFQNFLDFCCTRIFDKGGVMINPKDGEILETNKFLDGNSKSNLTPEEKASLLRLQQNFDNNDKSKYCVDFRKWSWYMIHPFITNWRFSAPGKKQEWATKIATKKTNERLKNFMQLLEIEGAEKAFEICGASVSEILKIDKEIPAVDLVPSKPSRKRGIDSVGNIPEEEVPSTNKKVKILKETLPAPTLITFDLEKSAPSMKEDKMSLVYKLYTLLEESVVIPDDQFDKVLQAVNFLQKVFFQSKVKQSTCKVSFFRSWNLKLKTPQEDPGSMPLVYVFNRKECEGKRTGINFIPSRRVSKILGSKKIGMKISVLERPNINCNNSSLVEKGWTLECKGFGGDEQKTFKLCFFSSPEFIFEVDMSNLLKYLCKFDGRAYQMIKLAYFWMGLNKLTLEEIGEEEEDGGQSSLQWLVIFWMCHRKMVPSPREIQERGTHKVLKDGGTGVVLGWEEDKKLEEWREGRKVEEFEWREDYVVRLLEGFGEFLEFCGWLWEGSGASWILNTRSGELIERGNFLYSYSNSIGGRDINLSKEEIGLLRNQVVNYHHCRIYMTHPLNIEEKFGLRNDMGFVLKRMKAGGNRLKKYLNVRKSNGEKKAKEIFTDLKSVLTLSGGVYN